MPTQATSAAFCHLLHPLKGKERAYGGFVLLKIQRETKPTKMQKVESISNVATAALRLRFRWQQGVYGGAGIEGSWKGLGST